MGDATRPASWYLYILLHFIHLTRACAREGRWLGAEVAFHESPAAAHVGIVVSTSGERAYSGDDLPSVLPTCIGFPPEATEGSGGLDGRQRSS